MINKVTNIKRECRRKYKNADHFFCFLLVSTGPVVNTSWNLEEQWILKFPKLFRFRNLNQNCSNHHHTTLKNWCRNKKKRKKTDVEVIWSTHTQTLYCFSLFVGTLFPFIKSCKKMVSQALWNLFVCNEQDRSHLSDLRQTGIQSNVSRKPFFNRRFQSRQTFRPWVSQQLNQKKKEELKRH